MKNELGDIPKVSLEDENVLNEKVLLKEEIKKERNNENTQESNNSELLKKELKNSNNMNYYTKKDKFNKILTVILVASLTIIVVILLGFGVKKLVDLYKSKKIAAENEKLSERIGIQEAPGEVGVDDSKDLILTDDMDLENNNSLSDKVYYKGFEVAGYIRIPKTGINYPILRVMSNKSLETSVVLEYTMSGINKPGNTTISGHNYKNEQFFANNYKIQVGDTIFIKDMTGKELKYDVYDIKELR